MSSTSEKILKKFNLNGKVALVTGASRGLGRRFSYVLGAMGAKVVLAARNKEKLNETENFIKESGGECISVSMDVNDEKSVNQVFDFVNNKYGNTSILINNAGIAVSKSSLNTSMEDWDNVMNTNLRGVFMCSKLFSKHLVDNKK